MSANGTEFGIVVGVDGSAPSRNAVAWAAAEAGMRNVPLRLVCVVPPVVPVVATGAPWPEPSAVDDVSVYEDDLARDLIEDARKLAVEQLSARQEHTITTEVLHTPAVPTLVDLSQRAELMVVGGVGRGALARVVLGSVSTGLVHHAHCPVAVIHGDHPVAADGPVVVGIDGSPASERATAIAFDEASWRGVELVAVHAWSDNGPVGLPGADWTPVEWSDMEVREQEVLAERLAGWRDRYPDVTVRRVVVADRPAHRLLDLSEGAQLLVVGHRGRGGFAGLLLGSVSTKVVHSAQIPVIVARS